MSKDIFQFKITKKLEQECDDWHTDYINNGSEYNWLKMQGKYPNLIKNYKDKTELAKANYDILKEIIAGMKKFNNRKTLDELHKESLQVAQSTMPLNGLESHRAKQEFIKEIIK